MRIMSYQLQMSEYDMYTISNAGVSWNAMPQKENYQAPAICIKSEPFPEGYARSGEVVDIDKYINLNHSCEDSVSKISPKYIQAVHGKLKDWKLIGLNIHCNHIELMLACESTEEYVRLIMSNAPLLRFSVEARGIDGEIDKYIIVASTESDVNKKLANRGFDCITVTEYDQNSERDIIFTNHAPMDSNYTRNGWINITVVERR